MAAGRVLVTPVIGYLSNRFEKTALTVAIVSCGAGIAALLPAIDGSWTLMLVFAIGTGVMFGTYFVLDLKLAALVLPAPETAGRDLGLLLAAGSAPGVFAPALAAAVIASSGYPAVFLCGALIAIAGAGCAFLIRLRG